MSRYYKYNGKELPSVTTITSQLDKPALMPWAANMACEYILNELNAGLVSSQKSVNDIYPIVEAARKNYRTVSKAALDIGSAVHQAIQDWLTLGKEPYNPPEQVLSAFIAFLEWWDANHIQTINVEHTVYGPNYAGTCDLICMLNDKKYLIDFKSSKGVYPEMQYQIAGYRQTDDSIEGCGILRLDKETGLPEWKDTSKTYENDVKVFNILTDLWWATHPLKRKQFEEAT